MDVDQVWRAIDAERASLADLLDDLSAAEWETPSLCDGWRVRDVAAHLTQAQMGLAAALIGLARARGNPNRMIHDAAVRQAERPVTDLAPMLRAMAGSRRTAPGVTHLEPLLDVLLHGQDIAVPLGRQRPVPTAPAAAAAGRIWTTGWPWHARRRLAGFRLTASDAPWAAGEGPEVTGPVVAMLQLLSGRHEVALPALSGDGVADLALRLRGRAGTAGASNGTAGPGRDGGRGTR